MFAPRIWVLNVAPVRFCGIPLSSVQRRSRVTVSPWENSIGWPTDWLSSNGIRQLLFERFDAWDCSWHLLQATLLELLSALARAWIVPGELEHGIPYEPV